MCVVRMPRFSGKAPGMAAELGREHVQSRIRSLQATDAAAVADILREAPEAVFWPVTSVREVLQWQGIVALASETEGQVSGFLIGRQTGDEAEILNLALTTRHRRKGEGGALLTAAMGELRIRGVSRVFLEVRESNHGAMAFYAKYGFSKTGRREGYYRDPPEAAVVMEKSL